MKIKDILYVYGASVVYKLYFKFPYRTSILSGIYTFDDLSKLDSQFLNRDILAVTKTDPGELLVIV